MGPRPWSMFSINFVWKAGKLTRLLGRSQPAIVLRVRPRLGRHRAAATATAVATALLVLVAPGAQAAKPLTPTQVVRAWSRALNASDDTTAGSLFALRAIAIQGSFVVRLNTAKSAVLW